MFIQRLIYRALRTLEVDIIIDMGFFLFEIFTKISSSYIEKNILVINLFLHCGQGLTHTDFARLRQTQGGVMAFNNFLSASKTRSIPLIVAESNYFPSLNIITTELLSNFCLSEYFY